MNDKESEEDEQIVEPIEFPARPQQFNFVLFPRDGPGDRSKQYKFRF